MAGGATLLRAGATALAVRSVGGTSTTVHRGPFGECVASGTEGAEGWEVRGGVWGCDFLMGLGCLVVSGVRALDE